MELPLPPLIKVFSSHPFDSVITGFYYGYFKKKKNEIGCKPYQHLVQQQLINHSCCTAKIYKILLSCAMQQKLLGESPLLTKWSADQIKPFLKLSVDRLVVCTMKTMQTRSSGLYVGTFELQSFFMLAILYQANYKSLPIVVICGDQGVQPYSLLLKRWILLRQILSYFLNLATKSVFEKQDRFYRYVIILFFICSGARADSMS